jgi:hypothetical protein
MTIFHLIPQSERDLHVADEDCPCGPEIIQPFLLDECFLEGEIAYEHNHFKKKLLDENGNWTATAVKQQT